jgi:histidinol-phosphate aminotransferase
MSACRCARTTSRSTWTPRWPPSTASTGAGLHRLSQQPHRQPVRPAAIEQIIEASPGLVIVDEAYAPFTDASFLPRLGDWPNLLVMRTVSKMGLAGLRLGYLAGPADWLEQIDKVRLPYNINVLTQASAAFALRHRATLDEQTARIRADRATLFDALAAIDGLSPYPSDANFILLRTAPGPGRRHLRAACASAAC